MISGFRWVQGLDGFRVEMSLGLGAQGLDGFRV